MEYFLISGWILSVFVSLCILFSSFVTKDIKGFETGCLMLVGSIIIGYLVFYPFLIAVIIINRFDIKIK
jgi:hypothetical protein